MRRGIHLYKWKHWDEEKFKWVGDTVEQTILGDLYLQSELCSWMRQFYKLSDTRYEDWSESTKVFYATQTTRLEMLKSFAELLGIESYKISEAEDYGREDGVIWVMQQLGELDNDMSFEEIEELEGFK